MTPTLGCELVDPVTGFRGQAIARCEHLYRSATICLAGKDRLNRAQELWFAEARLVPAATTPPTSQAGHGDAISSSVGAR